MDTVPSTSGAVDLFLRVLIRILLVVTFALGGAGVASSFRQSVHLGVGIGLAIIALGLFKEKIIIRFVGEHKAGLSLTLLTIYVVILGFATYSELFDRGWFDWLAF